MIGKNIEQKLSVITVCYNVENTIKNTLESILDQTQPPFQYIIVDGKSSDKTVEIIHSYIRKFSTKKILLTFISEEDTGIYDAFNKGIKLAQGKWISFLGADDIFKPNALENFYKFWPHTEVDIIHSKIEMSGNIVSDRKWSWSKFKRRMTIAHVGAFHNKQYFDKYGLYNTEYKIAGDYELLLRAKEKLRTHFVNEVTVIMSSGGISNKQIKKVYQESTRAKRQTAGIPSILCTLDYSVWMVKYKLKNIVNAAIR